MTASSANPLSIRLSHPVVMGTLENPVTMSAEVLFDNQKDSPAKDIFIRFTCIASSKFVIIKSATHEAVSGEFSYADRRWDWEIDRKGTDLVPTGQYTKSVSTTLHPFWPSSCSHKNGAVSYIITATIKNMNQYGYLVTEHEAQAEVWVLNSTLPPKSLGIYESPRWTQADWQSRTLRCTLSLKSGTVFVGKPTTLKVYMYKFLQGSMYDGRDVDVLGAQFTLVETRVLRAKNREETYRDVCEVAKIQVREGWPQGKGSWNREINMPIPTSSVLSTSMRTTYMDISHHIAMILEVKGLKSKSRLLSNVFSVPEVITMRAQVDVVVAIDSPENFNSPAFNDHNIHVQEQKDMLLLEEKDITPLLEQKDMRLSEEKR